MPESELIVLAAAAFASATLSGVIGMGGGMILLGVMTTLLPAAQVVPIHGVVQMGSNTTRTLVFLRHVKWKIFAAYAPFLVVGIAAATSVWAGVKMDWFKPFIGLFLLLFLISRRWKPRLRTPPLWVYAPLGIVTGFLTLFVGATGPFLAPFFLRDDLAKEEVIATKAICQTVGHMLKIPAFLSLGFAYDDHLMTLSVLLAMVISGTVTGKRLLERLGQETFVRIFVIALVLLAVHLVGQGFAP